MRKCIAFLMSVLMMLGMTGCSKEKDQPWLSSLDFIAATGDKTHPNSVSLSKYGVRFKSFRSGGGSEKADNSWLTSDDALKLIDMVGAMPDVLGNEEDDLAYEIRLSYYDKKENNIRLLKKGYGAFPENWKEIVDQVNKVTHNVAKITDSTEITRIDGKYLKKNFDVDESLLPGGVTLDDFVKAMEIDYKDLFGVGSYYDFNRGFSEFNYKYLNIGDYRLYNDTASETSSPEELKAFAEEHLDRITSQNDICIGGSYLGTFYDIVRFDHVDEWKKEHNINTTVGSSIDESIDFEYWQDSRGDETGVGKVYHVYVEPEHRFLIISYIEPDYREIYGFFNR